MRHAELVCLHTRIDIVSTQLNSFSYCNRTLIILFNINHLFADSEVVTSIVFNANNSIQHYSFIFTQTNGSKYCYVIQIFQFQQTVKEFQVLLGLEDKTE